MINELKKRGFRENRVIESIFLTKKENKTNNAPIGIKLHNNELIVPKLYKETKTYDNLKKNPLFSINLTNKAKIFYKSIFDKELEIKDFELKNSSLTIKGKCIKLKDQKNPAKAKLKPKTIKEHQSTQKGYCRANSAIIEALIHYTKIPQIEPKEQKEKIKQLTEIVKKTGSKGEIKLIKKLNKEIK